MKTSLKFFITATDTDSGKTFVSSALLKAAAVKGCSTSAVKPVAAGATFIDGTLRNDDALVLQSSISIDPGYDKLNPVCLKQAIAPHVAAGLAGVCLDVDELARACRSVFALEADLTLVEGAGGWKVPLNDRQDMSDLVSSLAIPVILVVAMKLGCLNHALLTVDAIRAKGVPLAGWIANNVSAAEMHAYDENLVSLQNRISAPFLGAVPHAQHGVDEVIGEAGQILQQLGI